MSAAKPIIIYITGFMLVLDFQNHNQNRGSSLLTIQNIPINFGLYLHYYKNKESFNCT